MMVIAYRSDVGKQRPTNEDAVYGDAEHGFAVLADGMGGHQAGEVASATAVEVVAEQLHRALSSVHRLESLRHSETGELENLPPSEVEELLRQAVLLAHETIQRKAAAQAECRGMGTTLEAVVMQPGQAWFCHVGDSRTYLINGTLQRLTQDHTLAEYLCQQLHARPEDIAPGHLHVLTQAVGLTEDLAPQIARISVSPGDVILLCSDGLTDLLSDEEIEELVNAGAGGQGLEAMADALVREANARGGTDNISVLLMRETE